MIPSLLLICSALLTADEDRVFSGPQPGEKLPGFKIASAADDNGDRETNVMVIAGDKPVALVFVHKRTRPAFGLANTVMKLVADRKDKIVGGLVFLSDDPTEAVNWMNRVRNYFPDGVQKGVSIDGAEGPGAYGLNSDVSVTVLIGKEQTVTANFALIQPSLEVDAPKIFAEIAAVLGEKEVPKVAKYSNAGRMQGRAPNAQIQPMLRALINKQADEKAVTEAAGKIEEYVAKNRAARTQVGDIARRIIRADRLSNYGTEKAQEYLKKWAEEFKPAPERGTPKPKAEEEKE